MKGVFNMYIIQRISQTKNEITIMKGFEAYSLEGKRELENICKDLQNNFFKYEIVEMEDKFLCPHCNNILNLEEKSQISSEDFICNDCNNDCCDQIKKNIEYQEYCDMLDYKTFNNDD